MMTDAPHTPKLQARSTISLTSGSLRVLESYDEIVAIMEDTEPMDWVTFTVEVNQPEAKDHGAPLGGFVQMVELTLRDGFTRARYRAGVVMGHIEHLPPSNGD